MAASNAQVQVFVDTRVRPRCEQIRNLYLSIKDDAAAIDDVYANLTNSPTWTDNRADGPPHLMGPNDVLAWNTFLAGFIKYVEGSFASVGEANAMGKDQYPIVLDGCVRQIFG